VTLELGEGDVAFVLGPSGSGKSTLLFLMAGILLPDEGRALFNGSDLGALNDSERSALRLGQFGFVFQSQNLVPDLTVEENVALPLWIAGTERREGVRRARHQLDEVGALRLADRYPGTLSGGEGQRVALARAFVTDPRVVFADEPTGSLDHDTGRVVFDLLRNRAVDRGTVVMVVTHNEEMALPSDRRFHLRDGSLIDRR
jgi:putative ABC transport system ATP-binding protein